MMDTHDLVQDVLIRSLKTIESFHSRGEGALQGYFREAVLNRIRDELRRFEKRPKSEPIPEDARAQGASPLEAAIGEEALQRYEAALARLTDTDRNAVVARLELGLSHGEIAEMLGKPTADAARMAVARAVAVLARLMADGNDPPPSALTV